jgi:hypothetical protein
MTSSSARHGLAVAAMLLATLCLSSAADGRSRRPAAKAPLLTLNMGGCTFRRDIEAIVQRVHRQVPDRPPHRAAVRTAFSFGPLHGVGVAAEAHPDFSGEELYFREDREALRRVLTGLGFHIDRKGDVVEAAKYVNDGIQFISVSIQAIDPRKPRRQFPTARSFLGCGSL